MNRDEITELLPELKMFMKTLKVFSMILIISVFSSYFIALWLWSQEQTMYAIALASLAFIVFYLSRQQLAEISCSYLSQDRRYKKMITFVQENSKKHPPKQFIDLLEKAMTIIEKSS